MARGLPVTLQLREIKYGTKTSSEDRRRIARMLATWDDGGWRYCAGEIEQSVLDMLREDECG